MPSIVLISELSASAPKTRQEHTNFPSKVILQAPQSPVPQPSFVPVKCNLSLRISRSVSSGSQRNSILSPLIFVLIVQVPSFIVSYNFGIRISLSVYVF